MYTIKKNRIVIEVNKIGKMFEIKRQSGDRVITTYSKFKDLDNKISLLLQPLKVIQGVYNV